MQGLRHTSFVFVFSAIATDLQQLHPLLERMCSPWQIYLANVDP